MTVTNKGQLVTAAKYLLEQAKGIYDPALCCALTNVGMVLESASEEYEEDPKHPDIVLQVVELPNMLDIAISSSCTTECALFRSGTCRYFDKTKCSKIREFLSDPEE